MSGEFVARMEDELDPVSSTGQVLDDEDAFWQRLQEYVENHSDQDLMA